MVDLGPGKKVSTPFPAIVGQESLKRVLLALAVEDGLAGALVRGEKGTAKSTAVRAMADLLPDQRVVADCPYGCPPDSVVDDVPATQCVDCRDRTDPPVETRPTPIVTLPLGATRDRVVGTLSVADALDGDAEFEPGLLARANRGVLYVDEVNLLDDHLVDVLLDAAAMGTNRVERDGVSVTHPADFTLVGTMNPEEGELRPQLRDRFDLCVEVTGSDDPDERVEILERVLDDGDGRELHAQFADKTDSLRERVHDARDRRPDLPAEFKRAIVELCRDAGVEGHRADFATARAARAFAALDGRPKVLESDIAEAAEYALAHRMRSRPFEDAPDPEEVIDDRFDEADDGEGERADGEDDSAEDGEESTEGGGEDDRRNDDSGGDGEDGESENSAAAGESEGNSGTADENDGVGDEEHTEGSDDDGSTEPDRRPGSVPDDPQEGTGDEPGGDSTEDDADDDSATPLVPGGARAGVGEATAPDLETPTASGSAAGNETGRGDATPSVDGRGATVRTEPADDRGTVDTAASVRTAARNGRSTPTDWDLQQAVRTGDARTLTVFLTDASASMAPAMRAAKGVALELLKDAYTERDEVALIAFGGEDAEVLLPPTTSVTLAARHLKDLPTADRTPLPAGLDAATELIEREDPDSALVVLVSDGRANVADGSPTAATRAAARRLGGTDASMLAVDAGESRAGLLDVVCEATDAERVPLSALSPETVVDGH
ncbi:VWA domain-containing protein [Natranaeroarchaeum sulfidigenes]|uniref:AAA family ATPase n=1 Tax=Natranaeroarchaeum sulfidigenes TaxID=2784880 RepID=A0A897MW80_9EURY|nr:VWA domain-containing protein [Natranaeroarchaeum sulfidigenes]QSG02416.1 AAA family ATPase [Natranaeroarchaeum sulfidigenes]